jgi:pimeloyl-ACP methyl ester carboxylesterase
MKQQAVVFRNRSGARLFGVLDTPDGPQRALGVILLSPGIKMRVGPHRLYRRMADMFIAIGLPVLRFDFYGLGDSEGTLTEEQMRDVYNHIEVGRFVGDATDAMDWMELHCGTRRFILSGLCGGAVTGLLAGSRDERVAGLLALGITPVLASRAADPGQYMTVGQLDRMRRGYIAKLRSPKSWLRLLTLKSDYRVIWKSLTKGLRPSKPPAAAVAVDQQDNASPLFPPAFFRMASSKRPMLMVFGGSDRLRWEFEEKFAARHRAKLSEVEAMYEVRVIEHANHVLSIEAWQSEMLAASMSWLRKWFHSDLTIEHVASMHPDLGAIPRVPSPDYGVAGAERT